MPSAGTLGAAYTFRRPLVVQQHHRTNGVGQQALFKAAHLVNDVQRVVTLGDRLQNSLLQLQDILLLSMAEYGLSGDAGVSDRARTGIHDSSGNRIVFSLADFTGA